MLQAGENPKSRHPWAWIPTLYFAEGIPYVVITGVTAILYKDLHVSNTNIGIVTSSLGLPWVIKPLWSPVVEMLRTRREWIWRTQLIACIGLAVVAVALPSQNLMRWTPPLFLLLAFVSASHDVAADGFYILANSEGQQSFFSGVRNTCYRLAMLYGNSGLLVLAGLVLAHTNRIIWAWQVAFAVAALTMAALAAYHLVVLPRPERDVPAEIRFQFFERFMDTFDDFLRKPNMPLMVIFLLTYRLGEAQLVAMVRLFLKDGRAAGGLELTTLQVGVVYGFFGVIALLAGGIIGGILISRNGLRAWLWPMVVIMHAPVVMFVYLSAFQPQSLGVIGWCVGVEQFGYGFGFTAYMLYMIYMARGEHQTAHYAICTGIMALGLMVPGMWSGWLADYLGYRLFFISVLISTIPGFIMTALIPLDREFGKKA